MKTIIYPHNILRLLVICLLSLTSCTLSRADEGQHNFMNIGMGGSLPNSTVKCFAEDRSGYLWIGTFDGLVRYDGHSFEVVRPGHVEFLLACESGLYIGTTEGLYYMTFSDQLFKPCTWKDESGTKQTLGGTFISILSVANKTFALETGGKLWVGNSNSVDFCHFTTSEMNECLAICIYDTDKLLILTPQQLILYDVSKNSITAIGNHSIQWVGGENIYYSTVLDMIVVGQGIGHDTHTFKILNDTIIENGFDNILTFELSKATAVTIKAKNAKAITDDWTVLGDFHILYYGTQLTKEQVTDIDEIEISGENRQGKSSPVGVYNVSGMLVRQGTNDTTGLPAGIYIVGGKKIIK